MLGAMYVMSSLTGPSTQRSTDLTSAVIHVMSWRRPASVMRRVTGSVGSLSNLRALVSTRRPSRRAARVGSS